MKTLYFLLVATAICIQCNGFTNQCLPRPMREVPVTLEIKNVSADFRTSACKNGVLAISEFANLIKEKILNQHQQIFDCELISLRHRLCATTGNNTHHVTIYYLANLTCGDKCYHLGLHDGNNRDARKFFSIQVNSLRRAYRMSHQYNFSYNDMLVEVFYFKGRKVDFHFNCEGNIIQGGVSKKKKIPACICPSSCADPCQLPPETGRCQGRFLRYYHNTMSGQCQPFVYGGCGGNQNRFITQDACETACNVCPEGMVYKCGTSCPSTCDRIRRFPCTVQCVQGCFCKEGTVLLEEGGKVCVAPEDCLLTGSGQECPEGMVYKECGCPTTCDNKDDEAPSCNMLQCKSGCFCKAGTVLLEAEGEMCVAEDECDIGIIAK